MSLLKEMEDPSPFLIFGSVSLKSGPEIRIPLNIWCDTGAFQSLILQECLPFSEDSALSFIVLVEGFGSGFLALQLHTFNLATRLVSGDVAVAVCDHVPINRVAFILRNDLAGGRVFVAPKDVSVPIIPEGPD